MKSSIKTVRLIHVGWPPGRTHQEKVEPRAERPIRYLGPERHKGNPQHHSGKTQGAHFPTWGRRPRSKVFE